MEIFRKRATATTIYFPMIKRGVVDFAQSADWTPVDEDVHFSEDGAGFATTNGLPVHEFSGIWSLDLLSTELDGKVTAISIRDDDVKAVEDQAIIISTYGDDSAQLTFNMIADYVIRRTFQNACDSADGDTKTFRSPLGAIAKLVNKLARSGSNLVTYEDDDTTTLGTQVITTSASAEPITELDTT